MSTAAKPPAANPMRTIKVISHSSLIYWWPVWLVGFILAGLTYAEDSRLIIVPESAKVTVNLKGQFMRIEVGKNDDAWLAEAENAPKDPFPVRIAKSKNYGIAYVTVVLLVIFGV